MGKLPIFKKMEYLSVLSYTTPRLPTGIYSVSVTNPSSSLSATMENVLVYISQEKWQTIMNYEPPNSPPKDPVAGPAPGNRRVWG